MVVASFNISQSNRVPYVTQKEVLQSAIANNVDFSNLIENGDDDQQAAALQEMIVRASTKVDTTCFGYAGTLCAEVSTENGRWYSDRYGELIVHPEYWPILEVRTFAAGYGPGSAMQEIPLTNNNCSIERSQFIITSQSANSSVMGVSLTSVIGGIGGFNNRQFCEYTYVNGFANSFLAEDASADDTSIVVTPAPGYSTPVGFYPKLGGVTIWDGANDEGIVVGSGYDGSSVTIPLQNPLQFDHVAGTNVSAIPATIKSAVIHFIVDECNERGQVGISLGAMGAVTPNASGGSYQNHEAKAYDLLDEFKSFWGRS